MLTKNRQKLVNEMAEKYGYIFCQLCQKSKGWKFEVHHIIARSQAPNHPKLHTIENLIIVCTDCHRRLHADKRLNDQIVKERGLKEIFTNAPKTHQT